MPDDAENFDFQSNIAREIYLQLRSHFELPITNLRGDVVAQVAERVNMPFVRVLEEFIGLAAWLKNPDGPSERPDIALSEKRVRELLSRNRDGQAPWVRNLTARDLILLGTKWQLGFDQTQSLFRQLLQFSGDQQPDIERCAEIAAAVDMPDLMQYAHVSDEDLYLDPWDIALLARRDRRAPSSYESILSKLVAERFDAKEALEFARFCRELEPQTCVD